ncbi:uncharacterized protein EI90DRAFT_573587 [Cantharellus anzutake]|uniref:uncharacterized protein n=1 Tax=Cantharellus anzutake TaxID=1750568 RepID=UPI001905F3F5|nr:uncharacterized protein EI90DRAFT_573587 [Cantharellus anzutake]KAF8333540.1 hypothetical protein EI90DRAFT_573587 [Cantharellus anzutake]
MLLSLKLGSRPYASLSASIVGCGSSKLFRHNGDQIVILELVTGDTRVSSLAIYASQFLAFARVSTSEGRARRAPGLPANASTISWSEWSANTTSVPTSWGGLDACLAYGDRYVILGETPEGIPTIRVFDFRPSRIQRFRGSLSTASVTSHSRPWPSPLRSQDGPNVTTRLMEARPVAGTPSISTELEAANTDDELDGGIFRPGSSPSHFPCIVLERQLGRRRHVPMSVMIDEENVVITWDCTPGRFKYEILNF